jgi:shikimate kinase
MGVGKTTVGRGLAEQLRLPFYDVDEIIERRTGRPIAEIFAAEGESAFRALETEVLRMIVNDRPGVVATGGGTFTRPENRELIRRAGLSVWLDAPAETILERGAQGDHRPLWGGPEKARSLLSQRRSSYREADLRLELGDCDVDEAGQRLLELLASHKE